MNRLLIFLILASPATNLFANSPKDDSFGNPNFQGFIENCGQISNQFHEPNTRVDFLWSTGQGMNVQLMADGLSYDFFEKENAELVKFRRLDMRLLGAHPERQAFQTEDSEEYFNFVNFNKTSESLSLKKYASVRYNDVYPGVDWVIKTTDSGALKYDFYVENPKNVDEILIEYKGFDSFELVDGELVFYLGEGSLKERIPASWISETGEPVLMEYQLVECDADFVRLKIEPIASEENLDPESSLVIDPFAEFTWGTYYGGLPFDKANDVATDSLGNMFIVGTTSSLDMIASEGSYQDQFAAGDSDAFLVRFNAHGLRQWATYFGGSGDDEGLSIDIDRHWNIYITGSTNSLDSIASDSLGYQINPGGGSDGFLARFTRHGAMIWDTYIGGSGNDVATSCAANEFGRIIVGGFTDTPGFLENDSINPLLPFSGSIDGFLAEYNQNGNLVWSSYYGGEQDDYITGVVLDSLSNLIFIGNTQSQTGIVAGDPQQAQLLGETDGFMAKIDTLGNLSWGSYFGGGGIDNLTGIMAISDDVYICGHSDGAIEYSENSTSQEDFGGIRDGFVFKLYENGLLHWFTYLGGEGDDVANAISTDHEGDVYLVGTTESETVFGFEETHFDSIQGQKDAFIAKFTHDGEDVWRTYHGGEADDYGNGIVVYGRTSVYIVGETQSSQGISKRGPESGIHQDTQSSANSDGFFARFSQQASTDCDICFGNFCDSPNDDDDSQLAGICLGDSILLQLNSGALGIGAEWVWYENGCGVTDAYFAEGDSVWVAPIETTTYSVRYENVDDVGNCSSITIYVDTIPTAIASVQDSICTGSSFTIYGEGGFDYFWTAPNDSIFNVQNLVIDTATAQDEGIYFLEIHSQFGCVDSTEIEVIDFLPAPNFSASVTQVSCNGQNDGSIALSSSDTIPITYYWPELASDSSLVQNLFSDGYTVIATNSFGCISGDSIFVAEPPRLIDTLKIDPAYCDLPNGGAEVLMGSVDAPFNINWSNGALGNPVSGLASGNYSVLVEDVNGCADSAFFAVANLGFFDAIIEPDSIFLEFLETSSVEVYTIPETENLNYNWYPEEAVSCTNCANPEINPPVSMMLYAEVTSDRGCFSSDSVYLHRTFPPPSSFIPSVFSPNGDGLNDELCVMGYRMIACDLTIYDRWGNKVFHTESQSKCWDGLVDGVPAEGTFVYTFEARLEEGESISERGSIQILK